MPRRALPVVGVVLTLAAAGCGGDSPDASGPGTTTGRGSAPGASTGKRSAATPAPTTPDAAARGDATAGGGTGTATTGPAAAADPPAATDTPATVDAPATAPPRSWTATCPTKTRSSLGCAAVRGRVLAIQSHDPDGDGDLHVIAVGGDVTGPGLTVFDVRPSLRPRRDPQKGEYVTGAGPVFPGSLGQHQIQVDEFRVWRP